MNASTPRNPSDSVFLPGATIGILGSGQLGRMLAMVARRLGYGVQVFSPDCNTPAGQLADREWQAAYTDTEALRQFAQAVDVVTIEFENIPVAALESLQAQVPVYPQPHVLHVTQHRLREKTFLAELGIPVVPFHAIREAVDLDTAARTVGFPAILKTAGFGYDGKGQVKVDNATVLSAAWEQLDRQACILEAFIELEREISIIAARNQTGFTAYAPVENRHRNHILDVTLAPAELPEALAEKTIGIARHIMETLSMRGLLCVEFFISRGGELLVNELAPRPHNSGHYTIEATACSQFEQQLRAVCGLPLGDTTLRSPAVMINLLGDVWTSGEPDWAACLAQPNVALHLYGKAEARSGRKMGHLTALGRTTSEALSRAEAARSSLQTCQVPGEVQTAR